MEHLSADRWREVRRIFLEIADLPVERREGALDELAKGDPGLAEQVRRMLQFDRLEQTVMEDAAGVLAPVVAEVAAGRAAAVSRDGETPEMIGPFRVVRLIGSGASGVVYEGEQASPRRRVAIKVLRAGNLSADSRRRFKREAEVLGRLDHPGILRVITAGVLPEPDGRPYIVLEFLDGVPLLASDAARGPMRERLLLMARVCDAVQAAHSQGVIHRDLKPENIIVTPEGKPKVLDFGIARLTGGTGHGEADVTILGELLGTAAYMSPEQAGAVAASGQPIAVDTRSDVYALGAITYHLVSGRAPVDTSGRPLAEVLGSVQRGEVGRLHVLVPAAGGDIDAVVHAALSKDVRDRYASASELAAELRRAAAGEPVLARPPSALRQAARVVRKHPKTLCAAIAAGALGVWGVWELERTRERAEADFVTASRAADVLLNQVLDRLGPSAGTLETRRRIVEDLKEPVERFAAARPEDSRLKFNLARLKDAESDLAAHDREWLRAISLRQQATRILDELCDAQEGNIEWRALRSILLVKTGDALRSLGQTAEGIEQYERALAADEALVELAPGDPGLNDQLYWSYHRLGENLRGRDDERAVGLRAQRAIQAERLLELAPDRPGSLYAMLTTLSEDAASFESLGCGVTEIRKHYEQRLRLGHRLYALSPTNRGHVMRVAGDLSIAATHYIRCGHEDEADSHLQRAHDLLDPLVVSDGDDLFILEAGASLATAESELAVLREDREGCLTALRTCVSLRRRALHVTGTPSVERAPTLCQSLVSLARALDAQGRHDEADETFYDIVLTARAFWHSTESPRFIPEFADICLDGRFASASGQNEVLDAAEAIAAARPESSVAKLLRAEVMWRMGDLEGARAIWRAIAAADQGECGEWAADRASRNQR